MKTEPMRCIIQKNRQTRQITTIFKKRKNEIKTKNIDGLACGLCGMLESVANYILKIKRNDYRIEIVEQACIAKGGDCLQFICKIHDYAEWKVLMDSRIKALNTLGINFAELIFDK